MVAAAAEEDKSSEEASEEEWMPKAKRGGVAAGEKAAARLAPLRAAAVPVKAISRGATPSKKRLEGLGVVPSPAARAQRPAAVAAAADAEEAKERAPEAAGKPPPAAGKRAGGKAVSETSAMRSRGARAAARPAAAAEALPIEAPQPHPSAAAKRKRAAEAAAIAAAAAPDEAELAAPAAAARAPTLPLPEVEAAELALPAAAAAVESEEEDEWMQYMGMLEAAAYEEGEEVAAGRALAAALAGARTPLRAGVCRYCQLNVNGPTRACCFFCLYSNQYAAVRLLGSMDRCFQLAPRLVHTYHPASSHTDTSSHRTTMF